jgi:peptidoglycan hydrolase CwlO-like protein
MSTRRRYLSGALALALVLGVASSAALPAGADRNSLNDKKRQQQQVRQQRALIASQIDTLKASDRQIDSALKAINANVQGTQAELESAQRALDQANHDAAVARQGIEDATSSITQLQTTLAGLAVDSYVHPLGDTMLAVLNTTNISDAAQKRAFLTVVHQRDADVADQIKQAREDLTVQQQLAEDAAARADASRVTITGELEKLQAAKEQQLQFEDKVQQRLDAALSEAAVLESQDKQLASEISKEQAAIAAQLRRRGGGRGTALPPIGNVNVVNAGGIYVAASIADNVSALLDAAAADGVPLSGWGYRDTNAQVALRQAHCGGSQYAVYAMPSYQCHPPTAPPGASMHERGLAIDFTCGGTTIGSHSSPCYKWLSAHASQYGLYNLPSEPWHWSTNGN